MNASSQEARHDRLSVCKCTVNVLQICKLFSMGVNQCVEFVSFLVDIYMLALELSV